MGIGIAIRKLRKQAGLNQKELAAALEISQSAISHWEHGDVMPSLEKIPRLARALGVTEQKLFDELGGLRSTPDSNTSDASSKNPSNVTNGASHNEPTPSSPYLHSLEMAVLHSRSEVGQTTPGLVESTVPLITVGKVHAGEFTYDDFVGRTVEVPASIRHDHPAAQAMVVEGNCMNRVAGDGTIVVFDPNLEPVNERIVIVQTEDYETVIRRWHKGADKLLLTADSYEYYPDIVIEGDRPFRVLGTVVYIITPHDML